MSTRPKPTLEGQGIVLTAVKKIRLFPRYRLDIPFARDEANRYLPWIVGVMVFLTRLMMASGITLNEAVEAGRGHYTNQMIVHIPYREEGREASIRKIAAELRQTRGVVDVKELTQDKVKSLVSPWLGEGEFLNLLPLPSLIEIRIEETDDPAKRTDIAALQQKLRSLVPGVDIDDNKNWARQFALFTRAVQAAAFMLGALIIFTTAFIVVLLSKTTLRLHDKTVTLLHSIGAKDDYIARQFQWNAFHVTLMGALGGTVAAAVVYLSLCGVAVKFHSPLLPLAAFTLTHVVGFTLLPFVTAGLAMWAARRTALRMLRVMH